MRHHKKVKKLHKKTGPRRAFIRVLAQNLIRDEKIKTTKVRAQVVKAFVERLVTLAKTQNLAKRRLVIARLGGNKKLGNKLFDVIAPRYLNRKGGYLRMIKLAETRKRDAAPQVILEFV